MRFGGALQCILNQVLTVESRLGTVYLIKADLADAYMRLLVRMDDVPSVSFLIPNKNTSDTQLVVFHILLLMGYIDSATYFCMATETVTDLANEAITLKEQAGEHILELAAKDRVADEAGAPIAMADVS